MIEGVRCDCVDDVTCRNPVLYFGIEPTLRLSAVVWTMDATGKIQRARRECLEYAVERVRVGLPGYEVWLIAGDFRPLPDDRITRYYGFWRRIKSAGIVFPEGTFLCESVLACEEGLRFFGAVRCASDRMGDIYRIMSSTHASVIAIPGSRAEEVVTALVQNGWEERISCRPKPPKALLDAVCGQSGLVLEIYGNFDDPEVSVAAIGTKEVLTGRNWGG